MSEWDGTAWAGVPAEIDPTSDYWQKRRTMAVQARSIDSFTSYPGLTEKLLAVQGLTARPWRFPSIAEALGVPAIFAAVQLVSSLVGSMTMRALRNEVELPPSERPRIIVRPDPFTIPREFYRSTSYNLATRGEAWWWIARRDTDGLAASLLNLPPHEVTVEERQDDPLRPIIKWRDQEIPLDDIRQLVYAREPGSRRGHGPLQMCGAAISVAVESQEWAANYFIEDGGHPSTIIKSATPLGETATGEHEADILRSDWMSKPNNTPRVIDPGIEDVISVPANDSGAAMLQSRGYQNAEIATMFNMDATVLNAAVNGSSITYQNVAEEFEKLLRQCLRPNYLEVIEQTMTDLLTRSTVARFNTAALTMDNPKDRAEVWSKLVPIGIVLPDEARRIEGFEPGDVENAAVPLAPPQAVPTSLPVTRSDTEYRCDGKRVLRGILRPCGKLLAESGTFVGTCPRCGKVHEAAAVA